MSIPQASAAAVDGAESPSVTINAQEDGTAVITVNGTDTVLHQRDLASATKAAVDHVAAVVATPAGKPIRALAIDPSTGQNLIEIAPNGRVSILPLEVVDEAPAPVEVTPEPEDVPAPVEEAPVVVEEVPVVVDEAPVPSAAAQSDEETESVPVTRRERRLTARDFAATMPEAPAAPAAEGWRGSLNRASGGALRLAPGTLELNHRQRRASIQRGIAGHKTILVLNEKGGVGKTTVTWCLGATLGRVRGGTVLAWDNNEYKGTLGIRSQPAAHDHTARDLLNYVGNFTDTRHTGELVNFVRPQGENKFDVLASQSLDGDSDVIDAAAFRELHASLSPFYRLIVVDSGNNSRAETWQAAVEAADVLVLATIVKEDSSRTLASLADTLIAQGHEDKLANAVTVMGHTSPTNYPDLEKRLEEHMGQLTRSVVSIPYDAALDRGDVIDYDALTLASREAWLTAAAAVMDGLK